MANLVDTSVNGDLRVTGTMFGTQAGNYATCSTAGATAAKTATISGFTLTTGMHVYVKFSENNSAAVGSLTLNISGTGAKPIKCRGGNNLGTPGSIAANGIYEFAYDGTNWEMVGSAVTGVKGANESSYRWGNVNITAENVGAAASSHTHGNIQNGGTLQTNDITIANGDKLVVTDSSDSSKVARASIAFDGSTTTKALTPKGTFEAFAKSGDITTAIQALDVSSVGGDGKYISAISETDGKISAAATTMDTTPTANSTKAVTSGGIKTALNNYVTITQENTSSFHIKNNEYYSFICRTQISRWERIQADFYCLSGDSSTVGKFNMFLTLSTSDTSLLTPERLAKVGGIVWDYNYKGYNAEKYKIYVAKSGDYFYFYAKRNSGNNADLTAFHSCLLNSTNNNITDKKSADLDDATWQTLSLVEMTNVYTSTTQERLDSHKNDTTVHITAAEREAWNAKGIVIKEIGGENVICFE